MSEEQQLEEEVEYHPSFWERLFGHRDTEEVQGDRIPFWHGFFAKLGGDDTPTVYGTVAGSLIGPLGAFLKIAVIALGWLLLAASSFTFGYDFIGAWLFRGWLGDTISRFLSGTACLVLFDLTYTSALLSFFRSARSNAQRAFCGTFFLVAFTLGLIASVAGFMLLSEGASLDSATLAGAKSMGQIAVYAALVNLALYGIVPSALDPDNIARMLRAISDSRHAEQDQLAILIMENEAEKEYYDTVRHQARRIGQQRGRQAVDDFSNRWRLVDSAPTVLNSDAPPPPQLEDGNERPS